MADNSSQISQWIWDAKYRYRVGDQIRDANLEQTWRRVASALAQAEPSGREAWSDRFYRALTGFRFLPGGRILAGAGTGRRVTLFNCFVMGPIDDSLDRIFESLKEGALTMQQGGGVGYDFSTLRPRGTRARATGAIASGPVSFMEIWDRTCRTILSTGARRGAMMGTLRCDHPDIEEFVEAKRASRRLDNFNLSVQVSDDFLRAVRDDAEWPLVFPADPLDGDGPGAGEIWRPGLDGRKRCRVFRRIAARQLWLKILRSAYESAEPGVLFVDRINRMNNLWYREQLTTTNPCGEIPLPPYGACDLGSINLTAFVVNPFSPEASLDFDGIHSIAEVATRMLDNVIDVSQFPLEAQARQARSTRRIGLGITGLADALIMLGLHYGHVRARDLAASVMALICHTAYRTSVALAQEKGPFPAFESKYLQGAFVATLPGEVREAIAKSGIRNSHLTAIAPTGSISLLADNVSSGLEPVFGFRHSRRIRDPEGNLRQFELTDYALKRWQALHGEAPLPAYFVEARALDPIRHLEMQAALQPYVDNAISKTVNVPPDYAFEPFAKLYEWAYDHALKGCTTFRENPVTGSVLTANRTAPASSCCNLEREGD